MSLKKLCNLLPQEKLGPENIQVISFNKKKHIQTSDVFWRLTHEVLTLRLFKLFDISN